MKKISCSSFMVDDGRLYLILQRKTECFRLELKQGIDVMDRRGAIATIENVRMTTTVKSGVLECLATVELVVDKCGTFERWPLRRIVEFPLRDGKNVRLEVRRADGTWPRVSPS